MRFQNFNFRRGFFRLWLMLSVIWIATVIVLDFGGIESRFSEANAIRASLESEITADMFVLPVRCADARGTAGVDYSTVKDREPGPWENYGSASESSTDTAAIDWYAELTGNQPTDYEAMLRGEALCYYSLNTFRKTYNEYADVSDDQLRTKLVLLNEFGRHEAFTYWDIVYKESKLVLGVPVIVLLIGAAIGWAIVGFAGSGIRAGK